MADAVTVTKLYEDQQTGTDPETGEPIYETVLAGTFI